MNILLATDANVERAGVCLFMLQWIRNIRKQDKDAYICAYFRKGILDEEVARQYRDNDVELVLGELPQEQTSTSSSNRNKVRSDIRSILSKKQYDILHVNSSAVGFTSLVLREGVRAKVPVRISHSHGKNINSFIKRIYLWPIKKYNMYLATKYAGCSIAAGEYLFGKGIRNNRRWYFIPNTIDAERYLYNVSARNERREKTGTGDETILLGAVGMLTEIKNHQFMVEILRKLKEEEINAKLLILGEGEERAHLEKLVSEYRLDDDVVLYGATKDVAEWLSAFDIYLMTSLTEGLPISAVEAQANGLPCLLSDCIPADVDITPDACHLPIDQGVEPWTECIKKLALKTESERAAGVQKIVNAGFDNSNASEYIRKLYEVK